jgi:hypothetical protein
VFLRTLGLEPSRTLLSCGALAAFYLGSVALAFAAMSYTLWRSGGGTWRGLLRSAGGGAPGSPSPRAGNSYFGPAPGATPHSAGLSSASPLAPRGVATIQVEMERGAGDV